MADGRKRLETHIWQVYIMCTEGHPRYLEGRCGMYLVQILVRFFLSVLSAVAADVEMSSSALSWMPHSSPGTMVVSTS